jgi:hypothetical protein
MVIFRSLFLGLSLIAASAPAWGDPPSDPEARKVYDHNYKWLSSAQPSFIAANMRGANDQQYRERRQAALDIIREKRDLTTVPELLAELERKTFLAGDICEILGEWKAKKAVPTLQDIAADPKLPADVRQKAEKALYLIKTAPPPPPAPAGPSY